MISGGSYGYYMTPLTCLKGTPGTIMERCSTTVCPTASTFSCSGATIPTGGTTGSNTTAVIAGLGSSASGLKASAAATLAAAILAALI
jgi:hypothetical protein